MRKDLFYRLNVFTINLPPLRERKDDIVLFAKSFLDEYRKEFSKENIIGFSEEALALLQGYDFPGNVRELRNIIERAVLIETSNLIRPASLPDELRKSDTFVDFDDNQDSASDVSEINNEDFANLPERKKKIEYISQNDDKPWHKKGFNLRDYLDSLEKNIIEEVLRETNGKKLKAAEKLGLTRFALRHQLKKYGLDSE